MVDAWVTGVILSILGNITINLGTNIVKLGHDKQTDSDREQAPPSKPVIPEDTPWYEAAIVNFNHWVTYSLKPPFQNRYWVTGMILFISGNIMNFLSFGYAALTLLAGLSSIQFLTNILFSWFFLGDRITPRIWLGTSFLLTGNTMVVIFSVASADELSVDDWIDNFQQTPFVIYLSLLAVEAISIGIYIKYRVIPGLAAHHKSKHIQLELEKIPDPRADGSPTKPDYTASNSITLSFGTMVANSSELEDNQFRRGKLLRRGSQEDIAEIDPKSLGLLEWRLLPALFAIQSASLGCLSVLLAKSLSGFLRTSVADDNQTASPVFYLVLFLWFGFMVFWLSRMNKALRMFDGVVIIPTLQVFWIVFSIISGGIFFKEFSAYSAGEMTGFVFSVFLILMGVVLLTSRRKRGSKQKVVDATELSPPFYMDRDADEPSRSFIEHVTLAWRRTSGEYSTDDDDDDEVDQEVGNDPQITDVNSKVESA